MRYNLELFDKLINVELLNHLYGIYAKDKRTSLRIDPEQNMKNKYSVHSLESILNEIENNTIPISLNDINSLTLAIIIKKDIFLEKASNMYFGRIVDIIKRCKSNLAITAMFYFSKLYNISDNYIEEEFRNLIRNYENLSKEEKVLITPILIFLEEEINISYKYEICSSLHYTILLHFVKYSRKINNYNSEILSTLISLYSKTFEYCFENLNYFDNITIKFLKCIKKIQTTSLTQSDYKFIEKYGLNVKHCSLMNYLLVMENSDISIKIKKIIVTNLMIAVLSSSETITPFEEKHILKDVEYILFERLYENLYKFDNEYNFKFASSLNSRYYYLIKNHFLLLKNPLNIYLCSKGMDTCVQNSAYEDFNSEEELIKYLEILKEKNIKLNFSNKFLDTLIKHKIIKLNNVKDIKECNFFKENYLREIISLYSKKYSIKNTLQFCRNFNIEDCYEISRYVVEDLLNDKTLLKEDYELYLEILFCHNTKIYLSTISKPLLVDDIVTLLKLSQDQITTFLQIIYDDKFSNKNLLKKLLLKYGDSKISIKQLSSKELYLLVKENKNDILGRNLLIPYIKNLIDIDIVDLMQIYFIIKKDKSCYDTEMLYLENIIFEKI